MRRTPTSSVERTRSNLTIRSHTADKEAKEKKSKRQMRKKKEMSRSDFAKGQVAALQKATNAKHAGSLGLTHQDLSKSCWGLTEVSLACFS